MKTTIIKRFIAIFLSLLILPMPILASASSVVGDGAERVTDLNEMAYTLVSVLPGGFALDTNHGGSGTSVHLWESIAEHENQSIYIRHLGDGYYVLKGISGRYISVEGTPQQESRIISQDFHGGVGQQWAVYRLPDGSFAFRNRGGADLWLDVSWGHAHRGTALHLWAWNGTASQRWILNAVKQPAGDEEQMMLDEYNVEVSVDEGNFEIVFCHDAMEYVYAPYAGIAFELANLTARSAPTWSWPVEPRFTTITQRVGNGHNGIDIAGPVGAMRGTPVRATRAGTVVLSQWSNSAGNWIVINHGDGYVSVYMHLDRRMVSRNDRVSQNQQIGTVGNTGITRSSGHLHFEIRRNAWNGPVRNPLNYVRPGVVVGNVPNSPSQVTFQTINPARRYIVTTGGSNLIVRNSPNGSQVGTLANGSQTTVSAITNQSINGSRWARISSGRYISYSHITVARTVTFNANGGNVSSATRTVVNNAAIGTLPTPTRSGHSFEGWFTAQTGGTRITNTTRVTGNITFFARWRNNSDNAISAPTQTRTCNVSSCGYNRSHDHLNFGERLTRSVTGNGEANKLVFFLGNWNDTNKAAGNFSVSLSAPGSMQYDIFFFSQGRLVSSYRNISQNRAFDIASNITSVDIQFGSGAGANTGRSITVEYVRGAAPSNPTANAPIADGWYHIRNYGGRYLHVESALNQNGARPLLWSGTWNNAAHTRWHFEHLSDGYYRIRTGMAGNRTLEVRNNGTRNGDEVAIWDWVDIHSQQWRLVPHGNHFMFINRNSGLALDIRMGENVDGALTNQWQVNRSAAQLFQLIPTN